MTTDNKTPKTRTPRQYNSILSGALKLSLQDRVNLTKAVKASIDDEVKELQATAAMAKEITNGLGA